MTQLVLCQERLLFPSFFLLNYVYLYIYKYVPSFLQIREIERKGVHIEEIEGRGDRIAEIFIN